MTEIYNGNYLGIVNPLEVTSNLQLPAPPKVSTGTKILNTINQLLPTVVQTKQTVDILRNKTTAPGVMNTTYAAPPNPAPPATVGLSTGAKIGIGVGVAAVLTIIGVAVTRKKKGLGNLTKSQKRHLPVFYVTYTKKTGGEGRVMVKARDKVDALRNAKYSVFTGSNFRDAVETSDKYIKPSKQGYQGSGRQN